MRTPFLTEKLKGLGATTEERNGVEVVTASANADKEYSYVRDGVGITDFSSARLYRVPEEEGIDFLDELFPGNVAQLRFGRILHTFLPDEEGNIVADCFVCNNDDEILVICESNASDEELDAIFENAGGKDAGLEVLNDTHSIISVDGCSSYAPIKEIFGTDTLGLLYLSVERYDYDDIEVALMRTGKTGEFGYLVVLENDVAEKLLDELLEKAAELNGGLCGMDVHSTLRLDGRFFNIAEEGSRISDPLKLGLQWMVDFEKDEFRGSEALFARREAGLTEKIVGVVTDKASEGFAVGSELFLDGESVGTVQAACYSPVLDQQVGLALLPVEKAFATLTLTLGSADGADVTSVSMPPFTPKSLSVKLDDM